MTLYQFAIYINNKKKFYITLYLHIYFTYYHITEYQGKDNRGASLEELNVHLQRVFVKKKRQCLVLFPEGGFLRKRKPISHR